MRRFAALVLLVACDGGETCSLASLVDEHIAGEELASCGDLPTAKDSGFDVAAYEAARDCTLGATAERRPFIVRWSVQGIEGTDARVYVGHVVDGEWQVSMFSGTPTGPLAVQSTCTDLVVTPGCTFLGSDLCLTCEDRTIGARCGEMGTIRL